jgi:phosphate transport system permease protein
LKQDTSDRERPFDLIRRKRANLRENFFLSLIRFLGFMGAIMLVAILIFVAYNGIHVLNWVFITQPPIDAMTKGGIFPVIIGTVLLTVMCMLVVIPIGVTTAVFLAEYSKPGFLLKMVMMSIYTLAGVPSVVFGLFGLAVLLLPFILA